MRKGSRGLVRDRGKGKAKGRMVRDRRSTKTKTDRVGAARGRRNQPAALAGPRGKSPPPAVRKIHAAVRKVNADAWDFDPEMLFAVGVDPKNGRVLVKEIVIKEVHHDHRQTFVRSVESAAHLLCMKERTRRGLHVPVCPHPKWRIKKKRYIMEVSQKGEITYGHARFCTRCGVKMEG